MDRTVMLKQLLQENPRDAFARYGLALEYANNGDAETALAEFARLLEFNPDYVPGYQMAAQTLMRAGRHDEARKMLAEGIACATRTGNQHALSELEGMLAELG
jgi:cytochrome c-type biogenesis protein CcmH/NrfG